MTASIRVVVNPTAGRRRGKFLQRVLAGLAARHVPHDVAETAAVGHARRIAAELPRTTRTIVAAGGDGTINEVLNGLAAGGATGDPPPDLALVPLGTANVLAAEIGLTGLSPQQISDTIVEGQRRNIFLGRADDHYFAQMCGVGFDAHVVANVNLRLKRRVKKLAYVLASLLQIWRNVPRGYRATIDGKVYEAASVIVANGRFYAGRFICAPHARVDDPLLHVCLFRRTGRWNVIRYAWGMLSGRLRHFRDVLVVPAKNIFIESAAPGPATEPVQGDGDIIADLPVAIAAGAACVTLRCPA